MDEDTSYSTPFSDSPQSSVTPGSTPRPHAGGNGHGAAGQAGGAPGSHGDVTIDMPSGDVVMSDEAEQVVFARDLSMHDSAAVSANVVGDLAMDSSAMVVGQIQGSASLTDSAASVLIAGGPVDIAGGLGVVVITPELTVRDGGSILFTQREAAVFGAVFAAVVVAGVFLVRLATSRR